MSLNNYIKLGDNIKRLRELKGILQKTMAEDILKIPRSTYSNYENNNRVPDDETLQRIADALDTTPEALVGLNNSVNDNYENKLGHYEIYKFIQRYHYSIYSNLLEVLKEHIPEFPMLGKIDYKLEFERGTQNAVDFILQELTIQLLEKIIHSKESKIFLQIKNTVSTYNEKSIKESMVTSKEVLFEESEEIIENVLLEYATMKFIEEIKKQTGMEFIGHSIYPDIKEKNNDLIQTITSNIQNILFQELYSNILFLLIQDYYLNLNEEGKSKILDYISDLSDNQKYIKDNDSNK